MKSKIADLRKEIDALDDKLLEIIANRCSIVKEIGKVKKTANIGVLDESRKLEVLKKWTVNAEKHNLPKDLAQSIYKTLHKYSLKLEKSKK